MHSNLLLRKPTDGKLYVEDVFSTYLYTGNGSSQTITNGIDLAGKGGLVWVKARAGETYGGNVFVDTARGRASLISSSSVPTVSSTEGAYTSPANTDLVSFNSNGFTLGSDNWWNKNTNGQPYASWTFRKAPKFFDVVTYTGNGASTRDIAHSLGVAPGMIIVKNTGAASNWFVWHRSIDNNIIFLERTDAAVASTGFYFGNSSTQTASNFRILSAGGTNANGSTYVAYLFAHDTTADGVIQCGSYTANNGNDVPVTLGWEPQFIIVKNASAATGGWYMSDNMRGMAVQGSSSAHSFPNSSAAEGTATNGITATATGFIAGGLGNINAGDTTSKFIYLAIRRGHMRVPTDATKVYDVKTRTGTGGSASISGLTAQPDVLLATSRDGWSSPVFYDRLRGFGQSLITVSSSSEGSATDSVLSMTNTAINLGSDGTQGYVNWSSKPYVNYILRRAPGFFDVVCYTGTGVARTINHNLGVVPELMIVKCRDGADSWYVYSSSLPSASYYVRLNTTGAQATSSGLWNNTAPTSSVFSVGTGLSGSGNTYVAYLFASCPGVSKVGSYTGTGTTNQINCGFTNGARFVLIKRTDSTGDWYVYDSARGIIASNDPYLLLNSTAAEVTNTDYVDAYSAGFELSSTAPAALNANGGTYIYLAIA